MNDSNVLPNKIRDLPGPSGWPLLGNALVLDPSQLHAQLEQWSREHGDVFRFAVGPQVHLGIARADLIRQVLKDRPETFRRNSRFDAISRELRLVGVFAAEGGDWKRQRRLITPAFSSKNLAALIPTLSRITSELGDRLESHRGPIEVLKETIRYSVDMTCAVVFGEAAGGYGAELPRDIEVIFAALNRRLNAVAPYWRYIKLPRDRECDRALDRVQAKVDVIIAESRRLLASDPERRANPQSLLESLIVARDEEGGPALSDEELFGNLLTLLLAGEDTAASTMAWMMLYIGERPALQALLKAEVDAALQRRTTMNSLGQAQQMKMLGAVLQETLRLRGPAPVLFLETMRATKLNELEVPASTPLMLLTRRLSTTDSEFGQSKEFVPERWLQQPAAGCPHEERSALAFGAGPRICIGRSLALLEITMAMSMIVSRFQLDVHGDAAAVRERFQFTMEPVGLKIALTPRPELSARLQPLQEQPSL